MDHGLRAALYVLSDLDSRALHPNRHYLVSWRAQACFAIQHQRRLPTPLRRHYNQQELAARQYPGACCPLLEANRQPSAICRELRVGAQQTTIGDPFDLKQTRVVIQDYDRRRNPGIAIKIDRNIETLTAGHYRRRALDADDNRPARAS